MKILKTANYKKLRKKADYTDSQFLEDIEKFDLKPSPGLEKVIGMDEVKRYYYSAMEYFDAKDPKSWNPYDPNPTEGINEIINEYHQNMRELKQYDTKLYEKFQSLYDYYFEGPNRGRSEYDEYDPTSPQSIQEDRAWDTPDQMTWNDVDSNY